MFKWLFHILIFATNSGNYQNKEKSLNRQRKLGLSKPMMKRVIIMNVLLFQIVGGVVLGFSIWLRLDFWVNQYVGASDELQKYTIAVYIFIATGAVIIIFGIVGVYGAARPDKWALVAVSIIRMCNKTLQ